MFRVLEHLLGVNYAKGDVRRQSIPLGVMDRPSLATGNRRADIAAFKEALERHETTSSQSTSSRNS